MIDLENIIYPNPTIGLINLGKQMKVEVYNSVGVKVISGLTELIDLTNQPTGMYFLKIDSSIYKILKH